MNERFEERCRQIITGLWEEQPVEATYLGIHNFDSLLPLTDRVSRGIYRYQKIQFLEGLEEFEENEDKLTTGNQVDLELLTSHLKADLYTHQYIRPWERRSDLYPNMALFGVYLLSIRGSQTKEKRIEAVCNRLVETPRLLAEGIVNLKSGNNIPKIWTEIGIETTRSGIGFFKSLVPQIARAAEDMRDQIMEACENAVNAMREFGDFLENDLLSVSTGNFAIGTEAFNNLLKLEHHLEYTPDELHGIGTKSIEVLQKLLIEKAKSIAPGKRWHEVIAEIQGDHPGKDDLLDIYREAIQQSKDFINENELVSIPKRQDLKVRETPPFQRSTIPFAAFVPPAPFEEQQEGIFWVTPVDDDASKEQEQEQLQGHSNWSIPLTAVHEGFPGHHLQFCHAHKVKSLVRKQLSTSVFIEGWALYCEEMMKLKGFVSDDRHIIMQLKDQLWRAVRVVLDVGLHCRDMSFDEAVDMLVNIARLERHTAIAEVKRYSQTPTQPLSYLIGKLELMKLRTMVERTEGDTFDEKAFHDKLLSYGSIPFALIRNLW